MQHVDKHKKVYLPGLLGLRFVAAFIVFFGHLEQAKLWNHIPLFTFQKSPMLPDNGVTFFFVLSGFLITYLLLVEKATTGTVAIQQFYIRRMLRLWPLYYFFTFVVFFIHPHIAFLKFPSNLDMGLHNYFWERFWLFIAFSPHVASRSYGYPGVGGPLWSIGVEEYFYAIWAQVMKWFDKGVPIIALIVVVLCMMSHGLGRGFLHWNFDAMAIGAIGAWFYLNKPNWIEFIFSKPVQILTYIVAIDQLRVYRYYGPWFNTEVYSLVFLLIIMNVALNSKSFLKLENRFFRFMGEISYGFYVFQWMCNVICVNLYLKWGGISNPVFGGIVLLVGDFALTTLLAVISYRYLEQPFLRLRLRFSPIRSAIA